MRENRSGALWRPFFLYAISAADTIDLKGDHTERERSSSYTFFEFKIFLEDKKAVYILLTYILTVFIQT